MVSLIWLIPALTAVTHLPPLTELGELVLPDITPPAAEDAAEEA